MLCRITARNGNHTRLAWRYQSKAEDEARDEVRRLQDPGDFVTVTIEGEAEPIIEVRNG